MKKVLRQVPYTEGVVMVIYDDGTKGFKSIREGEDIPETQIDDIAATGQEMEQAKLESNPMLKKYAEQLRSRKGK